MEQNLFNQPKQDNQISIFDFETQQVRTVIIDNEIWFVASDVTRILQYVNGKQAIIEHCKGVYKKYPLMTSGGMQELSIINESGIYKLVLASKKPEAIKFKQWVTEKILPSIRKTGSYSVTPKPELSIEEMTLLVIQNMQSKIADQSRQLEEQKPKVEFADKISTTENAVSIGDYAKVIGWGQNKLFSQLRDLKILNDSNIPYQKFIDAGYFKVIEWILEKKNQAKFKTLITGKGQLYLAERIK
jgi:prophage antirepressor-like protein